MEEDTGNSTHKVEVVPVSLEKHPNADRLSVVKVWGYQVVTATDGWASGQLGAYVPPDSLVPVKLPDFSFLAEKAKADGYYRVKAQKLRGVVSFGLLVPAPEGKVVGDDVTELLGVKHYEPLLPGEKRNSLFTPGDACEGPKVYAPKYDLESFRRYHHLFTPGEPVVITEKLDGCGARYVFHDGKIHCGSRMTWKKEWSSYDHVNVPDLIRKSKGELNEQQAQEIVDRLNAKPRQQSLWWEVMRRTPELERFCQDHPDVVVYGEVYGTTNCIKYGFPEGNRFTAFDLLMGSQWVDFYAAHDLATEAGVPWVPLVSTSSGPRISYYDFDQVCLLAEGETLTPGAKAGTIREGVVVTPFSERTDSHLGRVKLKAVSAAFLEKYH